MMIDPKDTNGDVLIKGFIDVLPILLFIGVATSSWFNLQSQIIDLRARYDASTATTKDALLDLKLDVKENTVLVRELLKDKNNNEQQRSLTR